MQRLTKLNPKYGAVRLSREHYTDRIAVVCVCVCVCVTERERVACHCWCLLFWGEQTGHFQETYVTNQKFVEVRHFSDLPPGVKEGDKVVLGDLGQVYCCSTEN